MNSKVYSPECGCKEVTCFNNGTCECQGCGFVWNEEIL